MGLKAFLELSRAQKRDKFEISKETPENLRTINVVAATDPNEILSYPLSQPDVDGQGGEEEVKRFPSRIFSPTIPAGSCLWRRTPWQHPSSMIPIKYDSNLWLIKKLVNGFGFPAEKAAPRVEFAGIEPLSERVHF